MSLRRRGDDSYLGGHTVIGPGSDWFSKPKPRRGKRRNRPPKPVGTRKQRKLLTEMQVLTSQIKVGAIGPTEARRRLNKLRKQLEAATSSQPKPKSRR